MAASTEQVTIGLSQTSTFNATDSKKVTMALSPADASTDSKKFTAALSPGSTFNAADSKKVTMALSPADASADSKKFTAALSPGSTFNAADSKKVTIGMSQMSTFMSTSDEKRVSVVDLGYSLRGHELLRNVNAEWVGGQLHALMGPSGAGKTTLLRVVIGDAAGRVSGDIKLGGNHISFRESRHLAGFIPQDDFLPETLSPWEILHFVARLRGVPASRVQPIMDTMHLNGCAHTAVGSATNRGVSGGERKRCSIAVELMCEPKVLAADEPTSGLDSGTSIDVIKLLAQSSRQAHRCTIATIHQPSWCLLRTHFATVTLLSQGRIVYMGPTETFCDYFASLGYVPPQYENPVDFIMYSLVDLEAGDDLVQRWAANADQWGCPMRTKSGIQRHGTSRRVHFTVSGMTQFWVLLRRHTKELFNSRGRLAASLLMKLIIGCIVGTIWWDVATERRFDNINLTESAMFMCILAAMLDTLAATILHLPGVKPLLHREVMSGIYRFPAWYWSVVVFFFIQQLITAFLLTCPVYVMAGLRPGLKHFGIFFLDLALLAHLGATSGLVIGGLTKDFQEARNYVMPAMLPQIIFSGYVIPYRRLPEWAFPFYHLSVFQYALSIARINQFSDAVFPDCPEMAAMNMICHMTGEEYLNDSSLMSDSLSVKFAVLFALLVVMSVVAYLVLNRIAAKPAN